jgi:undecaprenyl-diphosphatase
MALVTIKPTELDMSIADEIVRHTTPGAEDLAKTLTWGADEHVLVALSAAAWLSARFWRSPKKPVADHLLVVALVTAALPHVLKSIFDQTRPDRLTVRGHRRGIPLSGRRNDAFPSGHAVHMGALASAAEILPAGRRRLVRGLAVALSLTRIALLAHWTTDVLAGFGLGVVVERMLRPRTLTYSDRRRP